MVAAEIERGSIHRPEAHRGDLGRDQEGDRRGARGARPRVAPPGPWEPAEDGQRQGPAPRLLAAARGGQLRCSGKLDRRHNASRTGPHHPIEPDTRRAGHPP